MLRSVTPLAAGLARRMRDLALLGAGSALVICLAVWSAGQPESTAGTTLLLILAVALLAPPLVLFVSYLALQELIELPARLREVPGVAAEHAAAFSKLADGRRGPAAARFVRGLFTLGRLLPTVVSFRELLTVAPLLRVVSPPFIALTIGAALLCLLEILLAVPALIWFLANSAMRA